MIRNALSAFLAAQSPQENAMSLYLAGGPTTHSDGSVTWNPPERYDGPFDGTERVILLPQSEIPEACRRLFEQAGLDIETTIKQKGCAVFRGKNGVIIAIDEPFMGITPDAVVRHERGHLNGWPHDHPD